MTNTVTTATVETLTAEVRVLMVGSRQVTLSVAKQLDMVSLSRLTPFGRVKVPDPFDIVIGAETTTGVLSLSRIRHEVDRRAYIALTTPRSAGGQLKPLRCRAKQPNGSGHGDVGSSEVGLLFNGWAIALNVDDIDDRHDEPRECYVRDCQRDQGCAGFHCTDECGSWDPRDYRDEITRELDLHITAYREDRARVKAAAALPLIVLAGLR
jgi:hypothetical protein